MFPDGPESGVSAERFALHLAASLLGHNRVLEHLNNNEKQTFALYWRSKLMIPNISNLLNHFEEAKEFTDSSACQERILFFDVTFEFVKTRKCVPTASQSHRQVSLKFGFFRLLSKVNENSENGEDQSFFTGGHYVSTEPMSESQLMSHILSLQLDPQSVTPEGFARAMADEFFRQGASFESMEKIDQHDHLTIHFHPNYVSNKEIGEKNAECNRISNRLRQSIDSHHHDGSSADYDVRVHLPYTHMGGTKGLLLLRSSAGSATTLDLCGMRLLSWDLVKNANYCHPERKKDESSTKEILDAFNRWKNRVVSTDKEQSYDELEQTKSGTIEINPNTRDSTSVVKSSQSAKDRDNTSKMKNKKSQKRRSFARPLLSGRCKKKKKGLVYDIES